MIAKEPEAAEPEPVVLEPLTADQISIPEGFEANSELITKFVDVLNNGELSPAERANALITMQTEVLAAASEANSKVWTDMQAEWQAAVKADPDIGGAKFQSTLDNVSKLVNEYGSNELLEAFTITGAGNNPHVIKFLNTLAGKLTEGGMVQGAPAAVGKSLASSMFPSMKD